MLGVPLAVAAGRVEWFWCRIMPFKQGRCMLGMHALLHVPHVLIYLITMSHIVFDLFHECDYFFLTKNVC